MDGDTRHKPGKYYKSDQPREGKLGGEKGKQAFHKEVLAGYSQRSRMTQRQHSGRRALHT